jgi:hypothetical protein
LGCLAFVFGRTGKLSEQAITFTGTGADFIIHEGKQQTSQKKKEHIEGNNNMKGAEEDKIEVGTKRGK